MRRSHDDVVIDQRLVTAIIVAKERRAWPH